MVLDVVVFDVAVVSQEDLLGFVELALTCQPPGRFRKKKKDDEHYPDHGPLGLVS